MLMHFCFFSARDLQSLSTYIRDMDAKLDSMKRLYDSDTERYLCMCGKRYKTMGHLKRHLIAVHKWVFPPEPQEQSSSGMDYIAELRASFMKCSLILRDTYDAYRMGDGDRIFLNAKFEMLCADIGNHTKYKLWLWRMLAYEHALLSPKDAYEYKWNCTANTAGGVGQNIPNDNLVELNVGAIKKKFKAKGQMRLLKVLGK